MRAPIVDADDLIAEGKPRRAPQEDKDQPESGTEVAADEFARLSDEERATVDGLAALDLGAVSGGIKPPVLCLVRTQPTNSPEEPPWLPSQPPQLTLVPSPADEFVGARKGKKGKDPASAFTDAKLRKAVVEVEEMIRVRDFTAARPRHFVALHGVLHARVYGVGPTDPPVSRMRAALQVSRLLKVHFDDDPAKLAAFVRWSWIREAGNEKFRRSKGDHTAGRRMGLGLQYSSHMVDDYRVDIMRRGAGGR
jgi:hypothetical protein